MHRRSELQPSPHQSEANINQEVVELLDWGYIHQEPGDTQRYSTEQPPPQLFQWRHDAIFSWSFSCPVMYFNCFLEGTRSRDVGIPRCAIHLGFLSTDGTMCDPDLVLKYLIPAAAHQQLKISLQVPISFALKMYIQAIGA